MAGPLLGGKRSTRWAEWSSGDQGRCMSHKLKRKGAPPISNSLRGPRMNTCIWPVVLFDPGTVAAVHRLTRLQKKNEWHDDVGETVLLPVRDR